MFLVLGGSGFVGGHVTARARRGGLHVFSAARTAASSPGPWPRLDLATAPADVLEQALHASAPDVVVNCAGATAGDPSRLTAANVVAVGRLLRAMACAVPHARLVHIGSAAEYGRVQEGTPVSEAASPRPVGPYGLTKLCGTDLVRAAVADGLDAVVLRVFNLVGPGAPVTTLPGRLVRDLRAAVTTGQEVTTGPLTDFRDFVDVRDVADAVLAAAAARGTVPAVVNIGGGRATRLRELATSLVAMSGGARLTEQEGEATGSPRSAGVPWQQADITCAARALHWRPATDLGASLRDMWDTAR